jgi:hypothetical protein
MCLKEIRRPVLHIRWKIRSSEKLRFIIKYFLLFIAVIPNSKMPLSLLLENQ